MFNIFIGINIIQIQEANDQYLDELISEKEIALAEKVETIKVNHMRQIRQLKEMQLNGTGILGVSLSFWDNLEFKIDQTQQKLLPVSTLEAVEVTFLN